MRKLIKKFLLGAASLPILGIATLLSSPQTASAQVGGCTLASLSGSYASSFFGQALAGPSGAGPFASAGRWTFDGAGSVTVNDTINYNGQVSDRLLMGTYTVDSATCRFTVTFGPSGGAGGDQVSVYPGATGNTAGVVIRVPNFVTASGTLIK